MAYKPELLDELLKDTDPKQLFAKGGLLDEIKKALAERILNAELDHHLAEEAARSPATPRNHRNGYSSKTVTTDGGQLGLCIPRDRAGTFEPQLIEKHQRRLPDFDSKVISMYARGLSVRDIQAHLQEIYGTEVSPALISQITDVVLDEVKAWQTRPLEALYPVIFFDAMRVKIRDEGMVRNKAVYLALGLRVDGTKDILGLWIEQTEGAKFWLRVMTELKNRGVNDVLIAVVDGLRGFPEAITASFPQAQVQTCIVHLIRHSVSYATWKERKSLAAALKPIYRAVTLETAAEALANFEAGPWGRRYPAIAQSWQRHWQQVIPFFTYPHEVRRMIYTTNAIESLNSSVRKAVRARGHFPSDDAATKLIYLVLREISRNWKMPPRDWNAARAQFSILFKDRFTEHLD